MPFDLQPTLKGEHLTLRPLHADDWNTLYAAASDPLIWEQHPNSDRYKAEVFRLFLQSALDSQGAFVALDNSDGKIIGSSRFYKYNAERSEIVIGHTFLARSHWGGKFNGEMKQLMLAHAFQFVDNVLFNIGPNNLRSRKAIEKIGGVLLVPSTNPADHESVVYQITAK